MSELSLLQKNLWSAVSNGDGDKVLEWISKGACVDIKSNTARFALYQCVFKENIEILKALINAGMNVDCPDKNGHTLLHDAAEECSLPVASLLLDAGANIRAVSKDGNTVMHFALYNKLVTKPFLLKLLEHGANVNEKTNSLLMPIDMCEPLKIKNGDIHLTLISYGAKLTKESNAYSRRLGKLTMHQAAAYGGLTKRVLELFREHPSEKPGDEPDRLYAIAKRFKRAETAAAIASFMAGQEIEKILMSSKVGNSNGLKI